MKKIFLILLLAPFLLTAQEEHATGLTFDDDAYEAIELKTPLTRGDYFALSPSASLKKYCPAVGNQGNYGTCVGWSSGYAARTILWAKENNMTSTIDISNHALVNSSLIVCSGHTAKAQNFKSISATMNPLMSMLSLWTERIKL